MSRIERKIEKRKKKRQLRACLFLIFILMIIGVLSVDFALREMLALEDTRVFGYEAQSDQVVVYIIGEKIYVENEKIEEIQALFEVAYNSLKKQLNHIINNQLLNFDILRATFAAHGFWAKP